MNISFYTAEAGVEQQQQRLNVHGNNIANVNTYGFKAKKPSFEALMTGPVQGIDEDLPRGVGSRLESAETDFAGTALRDTQRSLDYAISGSGFFALLDPVTGEFSYTRDGSFIASSYEVPVTDEQGEPVLDELGRQQTQAVWYLSDGMGRFVLGEDGRPVELEGGEDVQPLGEMLHIGVFDFVNTNGMQSLGDNRFLPVEKNGQVRLGSGKLVQGCLETSNTDLAYELAKVVESQRSFSLMLRMVQTSDEIETTVNNLR